MVSFRSLLFKFIMFRLLEKISELRDFKNNRADVCMYFPLDNEKNQDAPLIWFFVSTIGELNAIEPLIKSIANHYPAVHFTFFTDHAIYTEAFQQKYPDSNVIITDGSSRQIAKIFSRLKAPVLFVLAEIPCLLHDAPCRFSYAFVRALKAIKVPILVVNGWLYNEKPASGLDRLEKKWFHEDYINAIDQYLVQTEEVKNSLVSVGVMQNKISITGNIKFDAVTYKSWSAEGAKSEELLINLVNSDRPIVVTGCVTNLSEQQPILDAFKVVQNSIEDAFLVIVPRHPENKERMVKLEEFLRERNYRYQFRTQIESPAIIDDVDVLVLNTMGELQDFYAVSTISYVGLNHNVLEPLKYGKKVFVTPGWNPVYPSYPVYQMLKERGGIEEVKDIKMLGEAWIQALKQPVAESRQRLENVVASLQGATERTLSQIKPLLEQI